MCFLAAYGNLGPTSPGSGNRPYAKSVVLVIMENRDYNRIIGSLQAPYTNHVLVPQAALMTNSHAVAHPSLPNYFALFSGSTQDVTNDSCPHAFGTENVGAELVGADQTFAGYSESMPYDGYTGCFVGKYARKHNPWVNFTNIPASSNLVYEAFPKNPPTLAVIVPNLCNDMHDCNTRTGDAWLKKNLPPVLAYDEEHQGLLILTWDEAAGAGAFKLRVNFTPADPTKWVELPSGTKRRRTVTAPTPAAQFLASVAGIGSDDVSDWSNPIMVTAR